MLAAHKQWLPEKMTDHTRRILYFKMMFLLYKPSLVLLLFILIAFCVKKAFAKKN